MSNHTSQIGLAMDKARDVLLLDGHPYDHHDFVVRVHLDLQVAELAAVVDVLLPVWQFLVWHFLDRVFEFLHDDQTDV